jgi:uncharacterized membrane protein
MTILKRSVTAFIAATVVGVMALVVLFVEPREFHISAVEVHAEIRPDRSMLVRERVTYRFTGADSQPFTVATRDWQPVAGSNWRVTDVVARENGVVRATVTSTPYLYEWDIAPASGTRSYELTYRVVEAVDVWADTAELYWNWIGTTSPEVGQWSAEVTLPRAQAGDVRAWAHGPLDGVLRIEAETVRSAADDIPAGQFVDNRILMPTEWFDGMPRPEQRLDAILAEEARNAAAANLARERAERAEARRRWARDALTLAMGPLIVAAGAAFWWVWRRWGKDPDRPDDIGDYWREVPDDPPAVGAALLSWRRVGSDAYAATVMDLARRGHLRIEEIEVERRLRRPRLSYGFVKTDSVETSVKRFERRLLRWLFRSGDTVVTQDELVERAKADPAKANTFWKGFQKEVNEELDRRTYLARGKGVAFGLHAAIVAVLVAAGVGSILLGAVAPGIVGLVAAAIMAPLGILHRSRTPAGTRRHAEWSGLRRFLKDFSSLDEAPVGHLVLWDQYLVAATALGVADELIDGLRHRFPEQADATMGGTAWYAASSGRPSGSGFASFGKTFGSASVSSFAPPSSSSGGGGGFSSGGGGGGGGGGFGAR